MNREATVTANPPLATTPFIDSRTIGDATITVISEGELLWAPRFPAPEPEWRAAIPEADADGRVWLGLNTVIIRLGDSLIVVDPGLDDPDSAWQRDRPRVWPNFVVTRTAGLTAALDHLGIDPSSVTHVVITHPHGDHYAGVTVDRGDDRIVRFPHARHFIGRADWEGNPDRVQPDSDLARLELIEKLGLLELVDSEREVAPGVTAFAAPGESPGHVIVHVASAGDDLYLLGDLVHHSSEVDHLTWSPPHVDREALIASRRRWFEQIARENALAVTGHERFPPWGRIVAADGGYRWQRG
jgi:glyoxylase-like metal-dependent hydrolase (beta-lactamase superfamily II)